MENHEFPGWDFHNIQSEQFVQTRSGDHSTTSSEPEVATSRGFRVNKILIDPISNWVGKQLSGQSIPDSLQSQFQDYHPDFPEGLLVSSVTDLR